MNANKRIENRLQFVLFQVFTWIFLLVFTYLFLGAFLFNTNSYKIGRFNNFYELIAFIAIGSGITLLYYFCKYAFHKLHMYHYIEKHWISIMLFFMLLMFIVQTKYFLNFPNIFGWDVGLIYNAAENGLNADSITYFSWYPNNLLLLFIYKFIHRIALLTTQNSFINLLVIFNIVCTDLSIVALFFTAKMMFGLKQAYLSLYLSLILYAFFPWNICTYTDTVTLPFGIGLFLLYLLLYQAQRPFSKAMIGICMGIIVVIGCLIKPTIIIVAIAIIILHLMLSLGSLKVFAKFAKFFGIVLLSALIAFITSHLFEKYQTVIKLQPDKTVPVEHFILLGSYQNQAQNLFGTWNPEDTNLTFSQPNTQAMKKAEIVAIKKRLSRYGIKGYLSFLDKKARWVTEDGTFFWGGEGQFMQYDFNAKSQLELFIRNVVYVPGKYFKPYAYMLQGIWLFILFLCCFPILRKKKYSDPNILIVRLTLLGILLFLLLFESRSRYLINHLPFFCLLAVYGFHEMTTCFSNMAHFFTHRSQRQIS